VYAVNPFIDLDPLVPVGITAATMRFLDVFLLHCLLTDGPPDAPRGLAAIARNKLCAAHDPAAWARAYSAAPNAPRWC
jgi:gamma-glutamylcysteine synthetase